MSRPLPVSLKVVTSVFTGSDDLATRPLSQRQLKMFAASVSSSPVRTASPSRVERGASSNEASNVRRQMI